jgi:hypothetical protein
MNVQQGPGFVRELHQVRRSSVLQGFQVNVVRRVTPRHRGKAVAEEQRRSVHYQGEAGLSLPHGLHFHRRRPGHQQGERVVPLRVAVEGTGVHPGNSGRKRTAYGQNVHGLPDVSV